jgi:hypothetical protein
LREQLHESPERLIYGPTVTLSDATVTLLAAGYTDRWTEEVQARKKVQELVEPAIRVIAFHVQQLHTATMIGQFHIFVPFCIYFVCSIF